MTAEQWLPIPGYEGFYEISSTGRIRSLPRTVEYGGSRIGTSAVLPGRLLSPPVAKVGYRQVRLSKNGANEFRFVHQLVLEVFVGPRPDGHVVCHNDGDRLNNALSNLRWDTSTENSLDIVRHGHHHHANKTHCPSGHEYTPENTYRIPSRPNYRYCRECTREHRRRYDARRRGVLAMGTA